MTVLSTLVSVATLTLAATPSAAQQQQRPNIVNIWGDDISQSNITAYSRGMIGYQTPNIDRVSSGVCSSGPGQS
jgi:arylsulfatase